MNFNALSKKIKRNLKAYWLFLSFRLKKDFSMKAAFFSQVIGMVLNNVALFSVWYLLLIKVGNINGYSFQDFLIIQGLSGLTYGVIHYFFGGVNNIYSFLNQDKFIDLQLYPVNTLTVLLTKGGDPSNFGDMLQGVLFLVIYGLLNPASIPILLLASIIIIFGIFGAMLFWNSLVFFNQGFMNVFQELSGNLYFGSFNYPSGVYKGFSFYFMFAMLVIPIIGIPIEVVRNTINPTFMFFVFLLEITLLFVALKVWSFGMKKVESGSSNSFIE